jgi:hypothetical protein
MATIAGLVDGTWYSIVSLFVGQTGLDKSLNRHSLLLNRLSACFYLVIACLSVGQIMDIMI